jgi:hypothetical protein
VAGTLKTITVTISETIAITAICLKSIFLASFNNREKNLWMEVKQFFPQCQAKFVFYLRFMDAENDGRHNQRNNRDYCDCDGSKAIFFAMSSEICILLYFICASRKRREWRVFAVRENKVVRSLDNARERSYYSSAPQKNHNTEVQCYQI